MRSWEDKQDQLDESTAREAMDALEEAFEEAVAAETSKSFWAYVDQCRERCNQLAEALPERPARRREVKR